MINKEELKKQLIVDKIFRADGRFNPAWLTNRSKNYDCWDELDGDTIIEKVYLLFHERKYCIICGKPTKFQDYTRGYTDTCCRECKKIFDINTLKEAGKKCQSLSAKAKRLKTLQNKYGDGITNIFQVDSIKDKIRETNIEKYGVEHPAQNPNVVKKGLDTQLNKYGGWYTQTDKYKDDSKITRDNKISKFEEDNNCTEVAKLGSMYGQGFCALNLPKLAMGKYKFISNEYLPQIIKRYEEFKDNKSHGETDIEEFCSNILPAGTEIQTQVRGIIRSENNKAMELDIYIPDKKLAIEYNGVYWHSVHNCNGNKNYHLYKTKECEKQGIRLIHVWEDYWNIKQDIYKSIISSALGVYEWRIYARDCICLNITSSEYEDFLEANHIQGKINSSLRLGLFYNGELVQVAGWGKSRFKEGEFELHRMCSKLNTQIVGGFSKLIKHSGLNKFVSYVDRSLYDGQGYLSTGFRVIGETKPGYFYYSSKGHTGYYGRVNRISAQKHKLKKMLDKFDDNLTEAENMFANGYSQIWDCGNFKVEYNGGWE